MGFDINLYKKDKQCLDSEFDKLLEKLTGKKINKSDYFQTTKTKIKLSSKITVKMMYRIYWLCCFQTGNNIYII